MGITKKVCREILPAFSDNKEQPSLSVAKAVNHIIKSGFEEFYINKRGYSVRQAYLLTLCKYFNPEVHGKIFSFQKFYRHGRAAFAKRHFALE